MCYAASCNPLCGDCRPKRIVQAPCPQCSHVCSITRDEYLVLFNLPHKQSVMDRKIQERGGVERPACPACGADMLDAFDAAVTPAVCKGNRVVCGFPCGRATRTARAHGRAPRWSPWASRPRIRKNSRVATVLAE